jgi:hypothetical protein
MEFLHGANRIGQVFQQGAAEDPVERVVLERQSVAVGDAKRHVGDGLLCCASRCAFDLRGAEINTCDEAGLHGPRDPEGDGSGAASAVQHRDARREMAQEELPVRLQRPLRHEVAGVRCVPRGVALSRHGPFPRRAITAEKSLSRYAAASPC